MKSKETIVEVFGKMPYKPLVEEIKDYAIFHLDYDGFILSWNQGAQLIFGFGKDEIIGQNASILFTPEDRAQGRPEQELKKAQETGRAEDTRWHLRKDSSRFFAQGVTTALRDENGKLLGYAKIARDDTARKEMEEALLESEEKYRIVAETATDAIISIDDKSTILFINRAATRIFGYEIEQMIGQSLTMLMPEYLRHLHTAGQERYIKTGKRHVNWEHVEVPALHRNGHEFPLEISFGEFNKNNKHIFIGIARDITERKLTEEAARTANELFEIVARTTNDSIWDWNLSTNKLIWNEGVQTLFGYEPEQVSDSIDWWYDHLHPEDRERVVEGIHQVIDLGGQQWTDEYRFIKADGSFAEVADKGFVIRDGNGNPLRMLGGMTDIAERKRSEGILQRYRLLSEKARDIVWILRPDGQILEVNQAAVEAHGYTREELLKMNIGDLREPSTLPRLSEDLNKAKEGTHFETVHVRKDGTIFPVEVNANGADFGGERLVMSIVRDISERRQAEEIIRRTQARLESVLEAGLAGTFFWNFQHDRVITDENLKRYFSLSDEALTIGVPLAEVLPAIYEEDRLRVSDALTEAIEQTGAYQIEYRVNHSDGNVRWLSARGTVERDEKGNAVELTGFAVDITRIKEAEEERERLLRSEQAAREEAERANRLKDEFLATLSHELRTPLNAILGWSQMLQNNNLDEAAVKRATETIERNARAQSQLIDDILDVSRIITGKLRLDVRAVDLSNVISAAIDAARPAAEAKNIRLQTLIDPQATQISGDSDRLQQVVWNLLSNAIKFTPKDGRIQVRLERVNSHIEIVVSDTGVGIEPAFLPFVFERFRQSDGSMTRRHGGLGLGLAIVRQLVELHGGTVSVESNGQGQGATFIVSLPFLPVRMEPEEALPRVHPRAQSGSVLNCPPELSGLHVLLVDDEADSRDLLSFVLESCGARISMASSTAEAVELIKRERFDMIISDIGMPEEDGFSLIRKIRGFPHKQVGNIPAIALTAYARAEDRVQALRSGFQMHIAKPVESAELLAAVANLAGRTRNFNENENE
jgi:PAS domain S-box-containing protein